VDRRTTAPHGPATSAGSWRGKKLLLVTTVAIDSAIRSLTTLAHLAPSADLIFPRLR